MVLSVNYIWMRPDGEASFEIPSPSFFFLQKNAACYPDTQFNLWVEDPKAYERYAIPANVAPQQLNSLPAFSEVPVFSLGEARYMWAKVDIARLFVLKHVLDGTNASDGAIYTDFDVKDVAIHSDALEERLRKYGAAFGGTYVEVHNSRQIISPFENGYIAFNGKGLPLLEHILDGVLENVRPERSSVYDDIKEGLYSWAEMHRNDGDDPFPMEWGTKVGCLPVLPRGGFKVNRRYAAKPAAHCTRPAPLTSAISQLFKVES